MPGKARRAEGLWVLPVFGGCSRCVGESEAPGARGVSRGKGLGTLPMLGAAPRAEEPGRLPVPGGHSCCAGVRDALGTRARLPVSGKLPVRRAVRGSWCPGNAPGVRGMLPVSGRCSRCQGDALGVGAAAGAQGTGMLRAPEPARCPRGRAAGAQPGQRRSGIAVPAGPAPTLRAAAGAAGRRPLFLRCRGNSRSPLRVPPSTGAAWGSTASPGTHASLCPPPADTPRLWVPTRALQSNSLSSPHPSALPASLSGCCGRGAGAVLGARRSCPTRESLREESRGRCGKFQPLRCVFCCEDTAPCWGHGAVLGTLADTRRVPGDVCLFGCGFGKEGWLGRIQRCHSSPPALAFPLESR